MTLFAPINDNSIIKETNRFTTSWSRWFQEVTKILTGNQAIQLTSYLVADLPPATTEGQIIYVSNATGGLFPLFPMVWIGEEWIRERLSLETRYADKDDLPYIYPMYLSGLQEIGESYEEKDALDFMLFCWAKAPCVLLIDNDSIVGFAGLNVYAPSYDKKRLELHEYMFYIEPSHRGLRAWRVLCKAVQDVSDKFNLTFVGAHRVTGTIKHHERLIRMAGAKPIAILSSYGGK